MTGRHRVVFVDQVRALAVIMMLVGHSLDRFLGEPWRSGDLYRNYQFVRGLSSALFLTIAGFSFVIASMGRMSEYTYLSPRMVGRLKRIGFILFLGMILQIPSATLWGWLHVSDPVRWERFFSFNVLQNIGSGLLLLHGALFLTKTRQGFAITTFVSAIVIFALSPITYRPEVDAAIPMAFRGALNLFHGSRFPAIPLTAFILVGALFGLAYRQVQHTKSEWRLFAGAALFGLALLGFEQYIRQGGFGGFFPYGTPGIKGPGNTFARLGCALLIICSVYALSRIRVVLPRAAGTISKDSLAIYFVHLLIVYGSTYRRGVFHEQAHQMAPWHVALFAVVLMASMYGMARGLSYMRARHQAVLTSIRRFVLIEILCIFLCLPYVSFWGVLMTLGLSAAILYHQQWIGWWRRPGNPKKEVLN